MPHPTAVLLTVGLNRSLIGSWSPHLLAYAEQHETRQLKPVLPAVTCSVQSSMLTGLQPRDHGVVGNGWFNREAAEVQFWKQSNALVGGDKVWETAKAHDDSITCAKMFWWYNMYASADWSVTPRPIYKADGRKLPDVYSEPPELRFKLQSKLGTFPLFKFWGPACSIESSAWIANASKYVVAQQHPTLTLIYLPHLDYALQKLGPDDPGIHNVVAELDAVVGDLLAFFEEQGTRTIIASEYGIDPVDDAVHVNRFLREEGLVRVRTEEGLELLDAGASRAFAVADHQVAHVYVKRTRDIERVAKLCREIDGVEQVLDRTTQAGMGIDHPRAGELVLIADPRRWFSYYYWLDDERAPDFARTVDIHRKPGYDPVELFVDPKIKSPPVAIGWRLLRKRLGFRQLMDVIPIDASLVRGSHGRVEQEAERAPIVMWDRNMVPFEECSDDVMPCTAIRNLMLAHLGVPV